MSKKKSSRWFLSTAAAIVVLVTAYYLSFSWLAHHKEQKTCRAWAATLFDLQSFPDRFPKNEANETAHLLEELFRPDGGKLGIQGHNYLPPCNGGWFVADLDEPTDEIKLLPEEVIQYLERHQSDFAAVYEQVRKAPPQWESDPESLAAAPVPNLVQQRAFTSLISLDALNKTRQGKSKEALSAFEAAWTITDSLRKRPEMISQLIALSIDDRQARVLRKMKDVPPEWQKRLLDHHYRKSIQTSFACEAWVMLEMTKRERDLARVLCGDAGGRSLGKITTALARPYFRLCGSDVSEAMRRGVVEIQEHEQEICGFERDEVNDAARVSLAWWDNVGQRCVPNLSAVTRSAFEVMLTLEATAKILEVKHKRSAAVDGLLPQEVIGLESALCRGAHWDYHPSPDGSFTLTFNHQVKWLRPEDESEQELLVVRWRASSPESE